MGIDYSLGIHIDRAKVVNMRKRERNKRNKVPSEGTLEETKHNVNTRKP